MRQTAIATGLSLLAAIAAVVAFLAIDAASVRVPPGNNGAGYVSDPALGFDIAGRSIPAAPEIIAIGCSQTYGWGVEPEQTFTALAAGHRSFANLAVPSYGGAGSLAMLKRHADLRPRVVIYGLWAEHRIRNVTPCVETPTPFCLQRPTIGTGGGGYLLRPPGDTGGLDTTRHWITLARGSYLDRMRAASMSLAAILQRPPQSRADPAGAEAFVLAGMAATARTMGADLVVVYLPDYTRGWPPTPPEYAALAQREGFTFIDATAALRRLGDGVAIPGDGHLSVEAHAVVAALIASALPR